MTSPIGWAWPAVAALAVALAVVAGPDLPAAVAAGGLAIFAASMACVQVFGWDARVRAESATPYQLTGAGVRELFLMGRRGREELIVKLDLLEMAGTHREPRLRPPEQMQRLLSASREEFSRYLARRLARIEGSR